MLITISPSLNQYSKVVSPLSLLKKNKRVHKDKRTLLLAVCPKSLSSVIPPVQFFLLSLGMQSNTSDFQSIIFQTGNSINLISADHKIFLDVISLHSTHCSTGCLGDKKHLKG